MGRIHYLAYGSNLHPLRLRERIPSARLHGLTSLSGYRLAWHKRGGDGSGKCDLVATGSTVDRVHAAIFTLDEADTPDLDRFEGAGYESVKMEVSCDARPLRCFCYRAEAAYIDPDLKAYHWYRDLVLLGARFHGFPGDYLQAIGQSQSRHDPDPGRQLRNQRLLQRLGHSLNTDGTLSGA